MSGVASAIAGAAVVGGVAANSAAKKQVKGANNAITEQQRQFDLTRQDTLPQRQLGQDAISRIRQIYGTSGNTIDNATGQVIPGTATAPDMSGFFNSPDYQFNLAEGSKAINNSAAARSGVLSGRAVKEGERYASGLASREFSGFMDRLYQQAGIGPQVLEQPLQQALMRPTLSALRHRTKEMPEHLHIPASITQCRVECLTSCCSST
jgi:hypothetical protein